MKQWKNHCKLLLSNLVSLCAIRITQFEQTTRLSAVMCEDEKSGFGRI